MKLLMKFENGQVRSLNRIVGAILATIVTIGFFMLTDWAIDAEINHNDTVVREFLNKR